MLQIVCMKKTYGILIAILLIASGCFNTTEDFTISANGSGVYAMKMDMSGMFDMIEAMQAMAGDDSEGSEALGKGLSSLDKNMDTVIRLGSFTDTATTLTAEEKNLMKDATMRMVMNKAEKQFVLDLKFPYQKLADVSKIMALSQKNGGTMGKMFGGGGNGEMPATPEFGGIFDYVFEDGLLQKKLNEAAYNQLKSSPQFEQMSEAKSMMESASMSSVIRLPRKAKKTEGTGITLSEDGRTVTVKGSFTDMFDNPKALTFRIEY